MHALKRELIDLNWSEKELLDRIAMLHQQRVRERANKYITSTNLRKTYIKEHEKETGLTRKTLYNLLSTGHRITEDKAMLIFQVINDARKSRGLEPYQEYSELDIVIYKRVVKE